MPRFSNHKQTISMMCLALLVLAIPVAAGSGGRKCNPLTQKCNDNGHDTDRDHDNNDQDHNCTVSFTIGATGTSLGASCSESSVPKSAAELLTWPASFGVAVVLTAAGLVL